MYKYVMKINTSGLRIKHMITTILKIFKFNFKYEFFKNWNHKIRYCYFVSVIFFIHLYILFTYFITGFKYKKRPNEIYEFVVLKIYFVRRSELASGPDDQNRSGKSNDQNRSGGPKDPNVPNGPKELNGPSGTEEPNRLGGPDDPNGHAGPDYPNEHSGPEDSDGLGWKWKEPNGFWILNLIQILGLDLNLDPNIWIWILKKSKLVLLKK